MNLKHVLLAIIIIILVIIAVVYLMGMWEPTKPIAEAATNLAVQARDHVSNNLPTVIGAGGIITTIGGAALSKVNDAKKKLNDTQVAATTQINSVLKEKENIENTLDSAKAEFEAAKASFTEQQKQFEDYKKQVEPQLTKVKNLEQQLEGANQIHTNFVQQLTSGAKEVIDPATNQVYKVIALEKIIVK